ncbi:Glycosyltransferase sugar-Hypothetical protein region containing DXD motif [Nesidiocoris tenuis]|uniref:Alpha-1,4-N-acetylglucosaminyltransferase n=1 Tax=Nesidiocoris tenuis TaxID=355587 RepID=A0ABN7AV26_9HEMI|nr:Glycosyltransferase sugar-Hypothetical protein region containing DXD motif [Nesidiocoris tenuis]
MRSTRFWSFWLWLILLAGICLIFLDSWRSGRAKFENNYEAVDFEGFNNETGSPSGCYIVPNFVHFVRFNKPKLSFVEAVCILSAFYHQKPEKIYIHTNVKAVGKYWQVLAKVKGLSQVLEFKNLPIPREIFGQKLSSKWNVFHGGDVARLRILSEFGGLFLDNDSYLVRSINPFRSLEMSLGWQPGKSLQNQVIVAHKDARFLKLWLESYRDNYRPDLWYYNAGQLPTKILEKYPHLVHRVHQLFGGYGVVRSIFQRKWPDWKNYYALHLMVRHQNLLKNVNANATYPVVFDEFNIHKYPIAFRDMAYDVYPF